MPGPTGCFDLQVIPRALAAIIECAPANAPHPSAVKIVMRLIPLLLGFVLIVAVVAGCASVTTRVTLLDPALKYAPTQNVAILLDYPPQPHHKIALIEVQGMAGGSEAELLEEGRIKAQALGADAIVRLEVNSVYHPPRRVYDPWFDYPFYPRYRSPYRPFPMYPYGYDQFPFRYGEYRWVGGGNVQTLKAVAIKYAVAGSRHENLRLERRT